MNSLAAYGSDSDEDEPVVPAALATKPDKPATETSKPAAAASSSSASSSNSSSSAAASSAAPAAAPAKKKLPSANAVLSSRSAPSFLAAALAKEKEQEESAARAANSESSSDSKEGDSVTGKRDRAEFEEGQAGAGSAGGAGESSEQTAAAFSAQAVPHDPQFRDAPTLPSGKRAKIGPAAVPVKDSERGGGAKRSWVKDKEKAKRKLGQSSQVRWKTEGEMLLRQNFDS